LRIAVLQPRLRETAAQDAEALAELAGQAARQGAELLLIPEVFSLHSGPVRSRMLGMLRDRAPQGSYVMPHVGPASYGMAFAPTTLPGDEELGRIALPVGDAAMDPEELRHLGETHPDAVFASPRSESELQAEAMLELAVGMSESVTGLVAVVDAAGAAPGRPGHGGSAIILLGEILAEAGDGEEVIFADVPVPVPHPARRAPVPTPSTILAQRLSVHRGERPAPAYPADLS
jgi:hypothetical protein